MRDYPGRFIVLEGPEAAGKSTQSKKFAEFFRDAGFEVVEAFEPGGTALGQEIRGVTHQVRQEEVSSLTQALLMFASRNHLLETVIRPALARGAVVICDRFVDSTHAYQLVAGDLNPAAYQNLLEMVVGDTVVDTTFVFQLPRHESVARLKLRNKTPDYFESKPDSFHEEVGRAYTFLAGQPRHILIDADVDIEQVYAQCLPQLMEVVNNIRVRPSLTKN